MGWESSGVVGFDLGPLLQGQMKLDASNKNKLTFVSFPSIYMRQYVCRRFR